MATNIIEYFEDASARRAHEWVNCQSSLEVCCSPVHASAPGSGSSIEFQVSANDTFETVYCSRSWKDMHDSVGKLDEGISKEAFRCSFLYRRNKISVPLHLIVLGPNASGRQILISPLQHCPNPYGPEVQLAEVKIGSSMFDRWSSCRGTTALL